MITRIGVGGRRERLFKPAVTAPRGEPKMLRSRPPKATIPSATLFHIGDGDSGQHVIDIRDYWANVPADGTAEGYIDHTIESGEKDHLHPRQIYKAEGDPFHVWDEWIYDNFGNLLAHNEYDRRPRHHDQLQRKPPNRPRTARGCCRRVLCRVGLRRDRSRQRGRESRYAGLRQQRRDGQLLRRCGRPQRDRPTAHAAGGQHRRQRGRGGRRAGRAGAARRDAVPARHWAVRWRIPWPKPCSAVSASWEWA